jgi:hypothetical protein
MERSSCFELKQMCAALIIVILAAACGHELILRLWCRSNNFGWLISEWRVLADSDGETVQSP